MSEKKVGLEVEYVSGFEPGYLGRIVELHGVYYAKAWGESQHFEATVAIEMGEFSHAYDATKDLLLSAVFEGQLAGSIAIVGPRGADGDARLRWFILDEQYHGRGIGRTLLKRAIEFCREKRYASVHLWTVEGLPESFALYERSGFAITERVVDLRHGIERINLKMSLTL
jgi:GNAT superfamily N-acetyltransferase